MVAEVILIRSGSLWAKMRAWVRAVESTWARRKIMHELVCLDDHLLRDMGITRQDLESTMADPALGDPTLRLAARAREARCGRRASAMEERRWRRRLGQFDRPSGSILPLAPVRSRQD